jgi:hypothetical protein
MVKFPLYRYVGRNRPREDTLTISLHTCKYREEIYRLLDLQHERCMLDMINTYLHEVIPVGQ